MSSKKGFINVPFHWLFVILAGSFIMFLFAFFISMGMEASDTKLSVELLLHLDTIFSTLSTAELTETPIKLSRDTELRFSCDFEDEFIFSTFELVGSGTPRDMETFPVFSNREISSTQILTKTEAVNIPFTATSALFIIDTNTRYVGLYEETENPITNKASHDRLKEVMDLLPANSSKLLTTTLDEEGYRSFDNIVIITIKRNQLGVGGGDTVPEYFTNHNVRHIDIIPDEDDDVLRSGEVWSYSLSADTGYTQLESREKIAYHSPGFLLGTIVSPDKDYFECTRWKIMNYHGKIMALLLKEKADLLKDDPRYVVQCGLLYQQLFDELGLYKDEIVPEKSLDQYSGEIGNIESLNAQLEFESCPLIY